MTPTPWVVRGGDDPLIVRRDLADQAEGMVAWAMRRHHRSGRDRGAPLVVAAAALDGLAADPPDIELVGDGELAAAAGRAGIHLSAMTEAQAEQLRGYVSAVRGAAGENWVVDRLAAGDLPVPAGTDRVVLQDFTAPGADLVFYGTGGEILSAANVKVAADADVIIEHLSRYADSVPIVYATSDAAADAARRGLVVLDGQAGDVDFDSPVVIDVGHSSGDFEAEVLEALDGVADAADFGLGDLPWFSLGMIGLRALRRVQAGASRADALQETGRDAVRAGAVLAAGKAATELGAGDPLTLAISVGVGWTASAAMDVRATWRSAGHADTLLADLADQVAGRTA